MLVIYIFLASLLYMLPIIAFLPFRLSLKQLRTLFLILFISLFFTLLTNNSSVIVVLLSVLIYLCHLTQKKLSVICVLFFSYLLYAIIDHCIAIFFIPFGHSVPELQQNYVHMVLFCCVSLIVESFICFLLSHFLFPFIKKKLASVLDSNEILKLIFPSLFLCLLIFLLNIIAGQGLGYTDSVIFFNFALFGCCAVWTLFSTYRSLKTLIASHRQQQKEQAYKALQQYTEKIEAMNLELRAFKHDYANIMLSMSEYFETKDFDGMQSYFYEKVLPFSQSFTQDSFRLAQFNNLKIPELKGLVSAKLIYAHELGIEVQIEILEPIEKISMDSLDLSRLLGIYLDNAVEAAQDSEQRMVSFAIVSFPDSVVISIKNSYSGTDFSYSQMKKISFSTKGPLRGIGLYTAEEILSHYPNVLHQVTMKDHIFEHQLTFLIS